MNEKEDGWAPILGHRKGGEIGGFRPGRRIGGGVEYNWPRSLIALQMFYHRPHDLLCDVLQNYGSNATYDPVREDPALGR